MQPYFDILKDSLLNKKLNTKGYVVLPVLNKEDLLCFIDLYKKWHSKSPSGFYKSYFSSNIEYKDEVENYILEKCKPNLNGFFTNLNNLYLGGMFVVKPPTDEGHIPPHQDWTFVDENLNWSLNMWLPLQDVDERNGTLRFLEGSHLLPKTLRGQNTPEWYKLSYASIEEKLSDVKINAGEAVLFFHNTIHCSHFNTMNKERICLGLSIIQNNAKILFHYLDESNSTLKTYQINDILFYKSFVSNITLENSYIESVQEKTMEINNDIFTKYKDIIEVNYPNSIFQKIKQLFT